MCMVGDFRGSELLPTYIICLRQSNQGVTERNPLQLAPLVNGLQ